MSMTLMARAMAIKVGSPLRKLVLMKLADNANDRGECWPSYQHVADQCECSKSAVKTHISALVALGLIAKENRLGVNNGKGNTSNLYYLTLNAVSTGSPETPAPGSAADPAVSMAYSAESSNATPPVSADGTRSSHFQDPVKDPVMGKPAESVATRATTLPEAFVPAEKHRVLAAELHVDLAAEFAIFCDHHRAKGSTFKDWHAALNTWLRNAAKFNGRKSPATPARVLARASADIPTGFNRHLPLLPQEGEDDELI